MENKKILVVEDSPFMQSVIKKILEKFACKINIISTGAEAIDAITEGDFDLIFLDCQIPILSGYEVASEIRDREKKGFIKRRNVIIACTANCMEGDRQRCLDAGMDDHITKPVDENSIGQTLGKWLRG